MSTTIQPMLLVSMKTAIVRLAASPEEDDAAVKARNKARSLMTSACTLSPFGLLCPTVDEDKLNDAVRDARLVTDGFNAEATLTRVTVNIIVGRISADDVEAVRAINGEVIELLAQMEQGMRAVDAGVIREAANKAKALSTVLSLDAAEQLQAAIEAARSEARRIVKVGETSEITANEAGIQAVSTARLAFVDVETEAPAVEHEPVAPTQTSGGLFDDDDL